MKTTKHRIPFATLVCSILLAFTSILTVIAYPSYLILFPIFLLSGFSGIGAYLAGRMKGHEIVRIETEAEAVKDMYAAAETGYHPQVEMAEIDAMTLARFDLANKSVAVDTSAVETPWEPLATIVADAEPKPTNRKRSGRNRNRHKHNHQ